MKGFRQYKINLHTFPPCHSKTPNIHLIVVDEKVDMTICIIAFAFSKAMKIKAMHSLMVIQGYKMIYINASGLLHPVLHKWV